MRPAIPTLVLLTVSFVFACNLYGDGAAEAPSHADDATSHGTDVPPPATAERTPDQDGPGDDTSNAPGARVECACPHANCDASDEMPCREGSGLCEGGVCHGTGTLESIPAPQDGYWPVSLSLSADGLLLALTAERAGDGDDGESQVTVVPLDGGERWIGQDMRSAVFHPADPDIWAVDVGDAVELRTMDGDVLRRIDGVRSPMVFSPDGERLAAVDPDGVRIVTLDGPGVEDVGLHHPEDRGARLWLVAFSGDGTRVATGRGASGFGSPVGDVRVFDAASGDRLHLFDCPAVSGGFNTDGSMLAVACWNYTALYDLETGTATVLPAPMLSQGARFLASADDGERLLLGSFLGLVRIVRMRPDGHVTEAAVEFPAARDVVELPDGSLILAPWADLTIHRWTPDPRL